MSKLFQISICKAISLLRNLIVLSFLGIVLSSISCNTKRSTVPCGELNLHEMMQPVPKTAKFINEDKYIWGGSLIKGKEDGKYHMFYSRWPRELGMKAWVTHSEVAHAVADSPFGPFEFKEVALKARGAEHWDGLVTHNPTIHYFNDKYYLYYTGNIGDSSVPTTYWEHRNKQRIGLAVADNPHGPWKRFDQPLIDVSSDPSAHDALITTNPSVTRMSDGRYLMVYKASANREEPPLYGPVVHLTAIADSPEGPFVKQRKPLFTAENSSFPAEDPYVWLQDDCYYAILKDMDGSFTNAGRSLVLFYSRDGMDWKLAKNPLVSELEINWKDQPVQEVMKLERPQMYIEDGELVALLCAINETNEHSYNIQIPLK